MAGSTWSVALWRSWTSSPGCGSLAGDPVVETAGGLRMDPRRGRPAGALPRMDNGWVLSVRHTRSMRVPGGVPAGVLATITMDVAMVAAARFGGAAFSSDRLGPDVIGRWAYGLSRGRWRHADIRSEPAPRGELALGILTHYATGIILTQAYLLLSRRRGERPSLLGATAFGIASAGLPLVVLFPSLGYGWFGLRTGDAARIDRIMLLGHTAFGIGIGLAAPRFEGR